MHSLSLLLTGSASTISAILAVLLSSTKVLVIEDHRGPIFKSLSSSSEVQVLESFRGLCRLTWHAKYEAPSSCSDWVTNGWLICHCAPVRFKFMSISPYCLTAVLLSSSKVLVLEDPRGQIFKSLSLSSSLSLKSLTTSLDINAISSYLFAYSTWRAAHLFNVQYLYRV